MRYQRIARILPSALAVALAVSGAMAQQARMFGTVVDESGAGVQNVKLILEPIENGARVEQVSKGAQGSYLVPGIRPGRYALKVSAEGLALVGIKAEAKGADQTQNWKLEERVRPDKAPEIRVADGMEITCDLIVGKATEITTATGEKVNASADQVYGLLRKQVRKGDCAGALPGLEKFNVENPTYAEAFYLKGFCFAVLGRDDDALAALAKSREIDPAFAGTSTLMGKVHARNKRLPEAEAAFKQELENTTIPPAARIDALLSLGAVQRDQSKDAEAIATFEKAMEAAPNRPEPYVELSTLFTKAGQADKAAAILDKAKAAGADDPVAMLNVGIAYYNKKDYPHAESMFRRVTESKAGNSDLAMAYGLLGKLQQRNGKNTEAIGSFKKCLELDPSGRLAAETKDALKSLESKKK